MEERAVYRPYGEKTSSVAPGAAEDKGWIGQRYDAEAGLQYLNARYYDPELGMFLQPDWFDVTMPGVGTNRFAYGLGDPVNLSDPGGNVAVVDDAVIGLGILGVLGIELAGDILNDGKRNGNGPLSGPMSSMLGYLGDRASAVFGDDEGDGERESSAASQNDVNGVSSGGGCDEEADCEQLDDQKTGASKQSLRDRMFAGKRADEVNKSFGWGRGEPGVKQALRDLTPEKVAEMKSNLSLDQVKAARDFYRTAPTRGEGGAVAPLRAEYVDRILELWK